MMISKVIVAYLSKLFKYVVRFAIVQLRFEQAVRPSPKYKRTVTPRHQVAQLQGNVEEDD